jgi:hypothetical protein
MIFTSFCNDGELNVSKRASWSLQLSNGVKAAKQTPQSGLADPTLEFCSNRWDQHSAANRLSANLQTLSTFGEGIFRPPLFLNSKKE